MNEAEQAVDTQLNATRKHFPNGLGEYKTYRSNIEVVDSYGNKNNAAFLSRDADAWLMAAEAIGLNEDGLYVKPTSELRIPDPENYNFHDRTTGHDRQWNYTVHVGTTMDLTEALVNVSEAGNARRVAKLALRHDAPVNHKRIVYGCKTHGGLTHGDHKRDEVTPVDCYCAGCARRERKGGEPRGRGAYTLVKLVTGYRGKISVGHGKWITPVGATGQPTTRQARKELAESFVPARDLPTMTNDAAGQYATHRLLSGATSLKLVTDTGSVVTVRRSGRSQITVAVKNGKAKAKRTTCSHETYVANAVTRLLA